MVKCLYICKNCNVRCTSIFTVITTFPFIWHHSDGNSLFFGSIDKFFQARVVCDLHFWSLPKYSIPRLKFCCNSMDRCKPSSYNCKPPTPHCHHFFMVFFKGTFKQSRIKWFINWFVWCDLHNERRYNQ